MTLGRTSEISTVTPPAAWSTCPVTTTEPRAVWKSAPTAACASRWMPGGARQRAGRKTASRAGRRRASAGAGILGAVARGDLKEDHPKI